KTISGSEVDDGGGWLNTPQVNLGMGYRWKKPQIDFQVLYKQTGERELIQVDEFGEVGSSLVKGYSNLDFSVSGILPGDRISFGMGVLNILDVKDIQISGSGGVHGGSSYSLASGRAWFLRLKYTLAKM